MLGKSDARTCVCVICRECACCDGLVLLTGCLCVLVCVVIVLLNGRICHYAKRYIRPFNTKVTMWWLASLQEVWIPQPDYNTTLFLAWLISPYRLIPARVVFVRYILIFNYLLFPFEKLRLILSFLIEMKNLADFVFSACSCWFAPVTFLLLGLFWFGLFDFFSIELVFWSCGLTPLGSFLLVLLVSSGLVDLTDFTLLTSLAWCCCIVQVCSCWIGTLSLHYLARSWRLGFNDLLDEWPFWLGFVGFTSIW